MSKLTLDFSGLRTATAGAGGSPAQEQRESAADDRSKFLDALTPAELAKMFPARTSKLESMASTSAITSAGATGRPVGGGGGAGGAVAGAGRGSGSGGGTQTVPAWMDALESATGSNIRNAAATGGVDRSKFKEEFEKNPAVMAQLFSLAKAEVGSQGPKAIQMWMETVFNRAYARGRKIADIISPDSEYWPAGQHRPKLTENEMKEYGKHFKEVMEGSNLTDYATDNASSDLATRREKSGRRGRWENGEFFYTDFHYKDAMDKLRKETDARLAQKQKEQELASIGVDASAVPTIRPGDDLSLPPPGIDSSFMSEWDKLSKAQKAAFFNSLMKLGGVDKFNELWAANKDKTAREVATGSLGATGTGPTNMSPEEARNAITGAIAGRPLNDRILDQALKISGLHEDEDRKTIQDYLKNGGQGVDPARTPWCADFVNATLAQNNIKGTKSPVATSFSNWGVPVKTNDVKTGDILVEHRGRRPGEPGGHVGFATGKTRVNANGELEMEMYGGNQAIPGEGRRGVTANKKWVKASQVNVRRAPEVVADLEQRQRQRDQAVAEARNRPPPGPTPERGTAAPPVLDKDGNPIPRTADVSQVEGRMNATNADPKAETATPTAPAPAAAAPVARFGSENATPPRTESTPPAPATPPQPQNPATAPTVPAQPQSQQEAPRSLGDLQAGTLDAVAPSASAQRAYMQATKLKEDDNHFSMGGYNSRQA